MSDQNGSDITQSGGQDSNNSNTEKWYKRKINIVFAVFLILLWVFIWVLQLVATQGAQAELQAQYEVNAQTLAKSISLYSRDMIVDEEYDKMQEAADKLVEDQPIAYVGLADASDEFVVHTNRRYLGKSIDEMKELSGVMSADTEVTVGKGKIGTIMVGIATK